MPDPRWEPGLGRSGTLLRQRQPGLDSAEDFRVTQTESNRRVRDAAAEAATPTKAATPRQTQGAPIELPKPPPAPTIIDRFHKWARYVIVAKDHPAGEDPILSPAYAPTDGASSIAAGYAKASAIAARDGVRCPLIIMGGGGPWQENIALTSNSVDLFGWGNPVVEGLTQPTPTVTDVAIEDISFHTTIATSPAFVLPAAPPMGLTNYLPNSHFRFARCRFSGKQQVFLAQRSFYAEDCLFWQGQPLDYSLELAPCVIEQEDIPTTWSVLRGCRFYTALTSGPPETELVPMEANGWALKVSARRVGGGYLSNLLSYDGVFRTNSGASSGSGAIQSGVLLDDCYVYGSALVEGWTLAHQGGRQYAGIPIPERSGGVYAVLRGHDWVNAGGFIGAQYAIAIFDGCATHATNIAQTWRDPLTVNPLFAGRGAVLFRNSLQLERFDGTSAGAMRNVNATGMTIKTVMSATPAATWGVGAAISATDAGSQTNVGTLLWHPYFS